jgi:hypothetical protein
MTTALLEKSVVFLALLAAFPLFFLDKQTLGFRRFSWLGAFCTGLTNLIFLDPTEDAHGFLDKMTMAFVSVVIVPHLIQISNDSFFMGIATIPPFFVVIHLSVQTMVDSKEYWKLRAFMHMAVFILPYLNHLPSTPGGEDETEATIVEGEEGAPAESSKEETATDTKTTDSGKKAKTNKKKR